MYDLTLVNSTKQFVAVVESDGATVVRLAPGESRELFVEDPARALLRYERIELVGSEPWALVTEHPKYPVPPRHWPVTFLYVGDGPHAPRHVTRMVAGRTAFFMRGVPVTLECLPTDPWAIYEKVELDVAEETEQPSVAHPGYLERVKTMKDRGTERPMAELAALEKELNELATKGEADKAAIPAESLRSPLH